MKTLASLSVLVLVGMVILSQVQPVPTTIDDFFFPGSQPDESGQLETPQKCDNCHGGYDQSVEPAFLWRGSMMAQAARDPLFFACLAIANQDAPESGDLCIRCHSPAGWLEGRSVPTDGSLLNNNDREGVQCDFCHKLIKPTALGVNPYPDDPDYTSGTYQADQDYLSTLSEIPPSSANGMYIADASNAKRGPFVDAAARHKMYYSPFHRDAALCGTCHDVSNPAYSRVAGREYAPNAFGEHAPGFETDDLFPVERTYSEWKMSDYNSETGVYAPDMGGNKAYVATCQDCHMKDATGVGCNKRGAAVRTDLPLHDMTGGNTFIPALLGDLFPGETEPAALAAGVVRANEMLRKAATLEASLIPQSSDYSLQVRIWNRTGHKLPSGYPEGRRIWLHVEAVDATGTTVYESGKYDETTAELIKDADIKIYEIKPGISKRLSSVVSLDPDVSFHFVLNDTIYKDNRIPPRGFTNAAFELIQSPPIDYSYADGQYWDDTEYTIPGSAVSVTVTLYYQTISRDYVDFLREENRSNDWGQVFYDLWEANGRSSPVVMATNTISISGVAPVADFSATPLTGPAPLTVSFSDLSTNSPDSWSWDFGDATTTTEQNPTHIYSATGTYTVSLTASNSVGSDTNTKPDYITVTPPGSGASQAHIAALATTRVAAGGPNWLAQATATVFDENDQPIANATVDGFFNAPNNHQTSGTTTSLGIALIESHKTKNPPTDWCFEVTNVGGDGLQYDPSANVVTVACESSSFAGNAGARSSRESEGLTSLDAYPNPFNPSVAITFKLASAEDVELSVHSVSGRLIDVLHRGPLAAGRHTIVWDAGNLASGRYLYRLEAGEKVLTRSVSLVK